MTLTPERLADLMRKAEAADLAEVMALGEENYRYPCYLFRAHWIIDRGLEAMDHEEAYSDFRDYPNALPVQVVNHLRNASFYRVGDFVEATEEEVQALPGIGVKAMEDIRIFMALYGWSFWPSPKPYHLEQDIRIRRELRA